MKSLIQPLLLSAVVVIIALLTVTAIPALSGKHLGGNVLLAHMMASGALVFALPLFAIIGVMRNLDLANSTSLQRWGFWLVLITGLVTIVTMFICMLPVVSTEQMHELVRWHGYAGFAMVPSAVLLVLGIAQSRRMKSTRSATPG